MGCDIHLVAQARDQNGEWVNIDFGDARYAPFVGRNYAVFGFLADVRNYSDVTPIAPRRGTPEDYHDEGDFIHDLGDHSFSWLSVDELVNYDYEVKVEDKHWSNGEIMTMRAYLGTEFFDDLKRLQDAGAERIVFGFDS